MSGSILPDVADGASISDADLFYSTQSGVDKKVTGAQIKAYATPPGISALIASAIGVDLNTAGDTAMTLSAFVAGKNFFAEYCLVKDASILLDTASFGVWSGAAGTGDNYMTDGVYNLGVSPLFSTNKGVNCAPGENVGSTLQTTPPIVNVSIPQGAAATANFYVYGRVFP